MEAKYLLSTYLASDDSQASHLEAALCVDVLYPIAKRVVQAKLSRRHVHVVDDVVQDVVAGLVTALRAMRSNGACGILQIEAWVAGSALNRCSDYFAKEHYLRTRLSNAIRYVLRRSVAFHLWKDQDGRSLCAWHRCRAAPTLTTSQLAEVMNLRRVQDCVAQVDANKVGTIRRSLSRVFALACGSIFLGPLVEALHAASGSQTSIFVRPERVPEPAGGPAPDALVVERGILRSLWDGVGALPREQRLALLLNLRGTQGIEAFWQSGLLSKSEVAASIGLSEAQLLDLPWTDLQIYDHVDGRPLRSTSSDDAAATSANERKARQQRVINWRRDGQRGVNAYLSRAAELPTPPVNISAGSASPMQMNSSRRGPRT